MTYAKSHQEDIVTDADDPLDLHMQRLGVSRRSTWSVVSSQATLLMLTGMALGPQGLAVLTPKVLAVLDPAVPVALAVLGVTAAFSRIEDRASSRRTARLFSAAIILVGLLMALGQRTVVEALATLTQTSFIAILLAGAGWILSSRGASDEERRVFSIATFLLVGGVADYLSVSGLLLGWVAATAWLLTRTPGLSEVRLDAVYVQHIATALLLVTAGARVHFSWQVAALAMAIICVVIATSLFLRQGRAGDVALGGPLTPAVFAVAVAMDAARLDSRLVPLLSVVVLAASTRDVFAGHVRNAA